MKPTIHPNAAFVVKLATDLVSAGAALTLEAAVGDVMVELGALSDFYESEMEDAECPGCPDCTGGTLQ